MIVVQDRSSLAWASVAFAAWIRTLSSPGTPRVCLASASSACAVARRAAATFAAVACWSTNSADTARPAARARSLSFFASSSVAWADATLASADWTAASSVATFWRCCSSATSADRTASWYWDGSISSSGSPSRTNWLSLTCILTTLPATCGVIWTISART